LLTVRNRHTAVTLRATIMMVATVTNQVVARNAIHATMILQTMALSAAILQR
jgi:hypothetical protein